MKIMKDRKLINLSLHFIQETLINSNHKPMIKKVKKSNNYRIMKLNFSIF